MNVRAIALAVPLIALGTACQTSKGSSGTATTTTGPAQERQASGSQQPSASPPSDAQQPVGQEPLVRPGPSIMGHASDEMLSGHISEVAGDSLSVETDTGETVTLQVVPETTVELDGMEASIDDLIEGQPIRASYDTVDGQEIAVKIRAGDYAAGEHDDAAGADASTPVESGTGSSSGTSGTGSSSGSGTGSSGGTLDPKDMGANQPGGTQR